MKKMRKTIALVTALLMLAALPTGALAAKREVPSRGFTLPQVLERATAPDAPAEPGAPVDPDAPVDPAAPVEPSEPAEPEVPVTPGPSWQGNANDGLSFGDVTPAAPAEPDASAPDESVPGEAVDGEAVPGDAVDGEAVPEESVDGEATPGEAVPGESVPGESVPGEAAPDASVDGEAVPGEAVPGEAVDGEATPGEAVPDESVPDDVVDGEAVDGEAVPEESVDGEGDDAEDDGPVWSGDADNGLSFGPTTVKVMSVADMLDPNRSIDIFATFEGELAFGSQMTLNAALNGYDDAVYTIQWQTSPDNATWSDIPGATGASYPLTITKENYLNYWRVELTITDVIDG